MQRTVGTRFPLCLALLLCEHHFPSLATVSLILVSRFRRKRSSVPDKSTRGLFLKVRDFRR